MVRSRQRKRRTRHIEEGEQHERIEGSPAPLLRSTKWAGAQSGWRQRFRGGVESLRRARRHALFFGQMARLWRR